MKYLTWSTSLKYSVAVLVKPNNFNKDKIYTYYVKPLVDRGIPLNEIICIQLDCEGKKPKATEIKGYLELLDNVVTRYGLKNLLICEGEYFKKIAKVSKSEGYLSYILNSPGLLNNPEVKVTVGFNYLQVMFDSTYEERLNRALDSLADQYKGVYKDVGESIIHSGHYPESTVDIKKALDSLHLFSKLTFDIETFSLNVHKSGIATVTFCYDKHNGIAFPVECAEGVEGYTIRIENEPVKQLLRDFILKFQGKLIAHNASFDFKCVLRHLFMKDATDYKGLIDYLEIIHPKIEDTKLISYCALNSTEDYKLGLKPLSHEYSGNYAEEEIADITKIKFKDLLVYNLKDGLSTWYVYDKYYPIMVQDSQEDFYKNMLLASLKVTLVMETWGLPTTSSDTDKLEKSLNEILKNEVDFIKSSKYYTRAVYLYKVRELEKYNLTVKNKKTYSQIKDKFEFNLNSNAQIQILLYDVLDLPVLDYTATKQPSSGSKTIIKLADLLKNFDDEKNQTIVKILNSLVNMSSIVKILTGFIPAFRDAYDKGDGRKYINGCFNLGGTISGRLTSSNPNLQNLPANSTYGKMIKSLVSAPTEVYEIKDTEAYNSWFNRMNPNIQAICGSTPKYVSKEVLFDKFKQLGKGIAAKQFVAMHEKSDGFIFVSADFSSLEDRINALLTKDINKIKVYTDGYDGHCLRAYYYWSEAFPNINPNDPESVNSIKELFPKLRNRSKAPTFLLTYLGTEKGLMKNCGFTQTEANSIVKNYNILYAMSKEWTKNKLLQVCADGYATLAFGLRLRSPLLGKTVLGRRSTPYQAEQEARSTANAFSGQSYCMLNNRASIEFMERVWASEYRYDIIPCLWIHDAVYLIIRNNIDVIKWVNDNLIECMEWQDLEEIKHESVKLGGELDIHYPNWSYALTIKNRSTKEQIMNQVNQYIESDYGTIKKAVA